VCGIWKIYRENPSKVKEELSKEDIFRLLDDIGKDLIWIETTGGEPFLRNDLEDIMTYIFNNTNIVAGSITTNGLLPDKIERSVKTILGKVPRDKNLTVGVSIDGLRESYAKIRGLDGFDMALDSFLRLKAIAKQNKNLTPHIAYTISSYNAGSFNELYDELNKNHGIEINDFSFTLEHQTPFYGIESPEKNKNPYDLFKAKSFEDIEKINSLFKRKKSSKLSLQGIKESFYLFYLKKMLDFMDNPAKMVIPCSAGKYSAYIDPYGSVYPCTMWNVCLGNIKEKKFYEIWRAEKARDVRKMVNAEKCPICWTPCEAQCSWVMNLESLKTVI